MTPRKLKLRVDEKFASLPIPPLSTEAQESLRLDIKANGQQVPIICDETGTILDGMHRFKILRQNTNFQIVKGLTDEQKIGLAITVNLNRRNLSPDQKRELRMEQIRYAKEWREKDATFWTQKKIAETFGVSQPLVAEWFISNISPDSSNNSNRPDAKVKVNTEDREQIAERVESGETQSQVAADFGITQGRVSQVVALQKKKDEAANKPAPPPPSGTYKVILADPPWTYEFSQSPNRDLDNQYPTMTLDEICDLKVPDLARDDCILFMWTTSPKLEESFSVLNAWGFTYKTCMVWVKDRIGMGYYARQKHEQLLIGTRGNPGVPEPANRPPSVIEAKRTRHSEKPGEFYEAIEAMYPLDGKSHIELFCRKQRKGWDAWGNEADG